MANAGRDAVHLGLHGIESPFHGLKARPSRTKCSRCDSRRSTRHATGGTRKTGPSRSSLPSPLAELGQAIDNSVRGLYGSNVVSLEKLRQLKGKKRMNQRGNSAPPAEFESATFALGKRCSIQLSYGGFRAQTLALIAFRQAIRHLHIDGL